MTYDDAVKKINSLLVFGSKPGLERVSELVERIGSPDKKLKFVHVAGTNGKGSVCASVASVLTKAGYKTGLFISPFVIEFRELEKTIFLNIQEMNELMKIVSKKSFNYSDLEKYQIKYFVIPQKKLKVNYKYDIHNMLVHFVELAFNIERKEEVNV